MGQNMVLPSWSGYIGLGIATLFFGTYLIPVKKVSMGDGFFFQFIMCLCVVPHNPSSHARAIWLIGFIVDGIREWPQFSAIAMIGGCLWCDFSSR